jgi:hypothetical protein
MSRLIVLMLVIGVVVAGVAAVRGIFVQGEWSYSDGVLLYHILRVRDGFTLYDDFHQPPFLMLPYWPFQVVVTGLLARLANLDTAGSLYLARGLTLAGALLGAAASMGITRHFGARRGSALVTAGLFLIAYTMHPWAYALRFDVTALGLVLAGVWLIICRTSSRTALLAGAFMALGFCTKQSFVVAPAAMTLALLWQRNWTRAAGLVVGWLLVVVPTFAYLQWSSDGWFLVDTITGNVQPLRLASLATFVPNFFVMGAPLLSLSALAIYRPGRDGARPVVLIGYGVLALAYGCTTLIRAGSNYNHLVEPVAVLAMLAGLGFDRAADLRDSRTESAVSSRAVVWTLVAMLIAIATLPSLVTRVSMYVQISPDATELIDVIKATPGPVLTEREAIAVILAGKEPIGGEPFGISLLARSGQSSPDAFNALIDTQTYSLIVLGGPADEMPGYLGVAWWPPGALELINARYEPAGRLGQFYLYAPKHAAPLR